jgi:hypothetical protein
VSLAAGLDPEAVTRYENPVNGSVAADVPCVSGHRHWDWTDCPGSLAKWLPQLRREAAVLADSLPPGTWFR